MVEVAVVLCADRTYQHPLLITLRSMLEGIRPGSCRARVFVATLRERAIDEAGLRAELRAYVEDGRLAELTVLDFLESDFAVALHVSRHMSITTYLRIFALERLSASVDRIIYLDCDLLFLDSILDLWNETASLATAIAAVPDPNTGHFLARLIPAGLEPPTDYFNAGVMVLNLSAWRKEDCFHRCVSLLGSHRFDVYDQDALNLVANGRFTPLSFRWNWTFISPSDPIFLCLFRPRVFGLYFFSRIAIVHYVMSPKPWEPGYAGLFGEAYRSRLSQSISPVRKSLPRRYRKFMADLLFRMHSEFFRVGASWRRAPLLPAMLLVSLLGGWRRFPRVSWSA